MFKGVRTSFKISLTFQNSTILHLEIAKEYLRNKTQSVKLRGGGVVSKEKTVIIGIPLGVHTLSFLSCL